MRESGTRVFPPCAPPATIERRIYHDPADPRQRLRIAAEPMTRTKRSKKGILPHVVGFVTDVARGNSAQLPP